MDKILTSMDIKDPGLRSLPPGVERYLIKGGGLSVIALDPDDKVEITDTEGKQKCEIIVFNKDGKPDCSLLGLKEKNDPKNIKKIMIFRTPECGSSVVNHSKTDDFQVLILAPFGVSFWRCFGSPNGGQGRQKATSKKKRMMPKTSPNWSQRVSQNGAKIVKHEVLEAPCFKGGSRVASRAPPGSILEWFWDYFGTIFVSVSVICLVIVACILWQHVANKNIQNHDESSNECSRELPRNSFSLRAILH